MSKIIDGLLSVTDQFENFRTELIVEESARKYDDPLGQIILNDLKTDDVNSFIGGFHRYRPDDRDWVESTAKELRTPEIIEIVGQYKDNTAISVMKALSSYGISKYVKEHEDGTKENSCKIYPKLENIAERIATSRASETIDKFNKGDPKLSWYAAESIADILLNTEEDENIIAAIADTIDHYDEISALNILDGLNFPPLSEDTFDAKRANQFQAIMTMDKVIEACTKYGINVSYRRQKHGEPGYGNDTNANIARNIATALTATAIYTQEKKTTELAAEIFNNSDKNRVEKIAIGIHGMCLVEDRAKYLPSVLESINKIYETDPSTAEILIENAGKITQILDDKTEAYLEHFEINSTPNLINKIITINNPNKVSHLIKAIDSNSITEDDIPKLMEYITLLDHLIDNQDYPLPPNDLTLAHELAKKVS